MDVITEVERRRRWRDEEKLRIVAETEVPGAVFATVARRHDVSRGQLWQWRMQARRGELAPARMMPEFIPLQMVDGLAEAMPARGATASVVCDPASVGSARSLEAAEIGRIEIVLPDGVCVRVDDRVGMAALRRVMAVLRG